MYNVVDRIQIEPHILFIRIEPIDIKFTIREIFKSFSDISWISSFDKKYLQDAFKVRAEETINYIANNIIAKSNNKITSNSGELVVSELSRLAIINELGYLDIPLAELIKSKAVGNDGFDFFTKNLKNILLFGEAKFRSKINAYGLALEQIENFINIEQDVSDIMEIKDFCCDDSLQNHTNGKKGFIASFASKSTPSNKIIEGIKRNSHYNIIKEHEEIICVAVNV